MTGNPLEASKLADVIDLADESTTCEALPDYPIQVNGASGVLINDSLPMVCGGFHGQIETGNCYIAGSNESVAKLLTPREYTVAIEIGAQMWITGGLYGSYLESTEIVDMSSVVEGPQLPKAMGGHCAVKVSETKVFFMHGYKTYFYDFLTNAWTNGPDMTYDRVYFGCGIMNTIAKSGVVVVTAGGFRLGTGSKTEFLTLDDPNGLQWTPGPDLPKPLYLLKMIEFGDTAIAIGGTSYDGLHPSNSLYKLVCYHGTNCEWKEMSQKLRVARFDFVAMLIPDWMTNCKKISQN